MTGAGNVFGDLPVALSSVDSRRLSAPISLKSSDIDVMAGIFSRCECNSLEFASSIFCFHITVYAISF